jgi:hypothetical protein
LVDDGSFTPSITDGIQLQLPGAIIITQQTIAQKLNNKLPLHSFPKLNAKRLVYPHLKKLTDIHTLNDQQWKLVLDSDMLFWEEPVELISWLQNPQLPLHMTDCTEAYGYSKALMDELSNSNTRPLINVGAIGLNSTEINWDKLEDWLTQLEEKEGGSYYLEQALTAMIIGDKQTTNLSATQYIVNPDPDSINTNKGILHHYVDLSKAGYFKTAWRKLINY